MGTHFLMRKTHERGLAACRPLLRAVFYFSNRFRSGRPRSLNHISPVRGHRFSVRNRAQLDALGGSDAVCKPWCSLVCACMCVCVRVCVRMGVFCVHVSMHLFLCFRVLINACVSLRNRAQLTQ